MTDNKKDMRDTYTIYDDQTIGKVQIADEVVAIIAGLAATEVEGVASMAGNITNELVGTGESIEQCGFTTVRITRKGYSQIHFIILSF